LNGISTLNKAKPEDLVPSVENHLNKVSGGNGYAQIDDGSGAIIYNMGNGDMPTYTLYMGKEGNKHRVSLEPTYGNDPKKLQGKIDKSFDNPKDAIKFMGDVGRWAGVGLSPYVRSTYDKLTNLEINSRDSLQIPINTVS
jgi:hypothetical protein